MKNIAVLVVALMATGCAARLQPSPAGALGDADRTAVMRDYVGHLPAGSRVTVVTTEGDRFSGTLLAVDQDRLVVQPRGRLVEPSRAVPIASLRLVEVQAGSGNNSLGKAVAIGVGVGAATFVTMLMVALATVD